MLSEKRGVSGATPDLLWATSWSYHSPCIQKICRKVRRGSRLHLHCRSLSSSGASDHHFIRGRCDLEPQTLIWPLRKTILKI